MRGAARVGLPAAAVLALGLALYWPTLLPDVGTWDTAEFQTLGPVLGIAHPTGYPTYTLVAWLASVVLQPFGNEAYRADLLSALLVAGAGALLAVATIRLTTRPLLGLLAGAVFVATPIAWGLGIRADAHALHGFLAALLLALLVEWQRRRRSGTGGRAGPPLVAMPGGGRWLVAAAIVYGLSLGNHALTLLLAPGIAVFVLLVAPRILWREPRLVLACLAAFAGTTVLVYAYLPLRSATGPPLDYAEPRTWERFWYLVLGEQFRGAVRPLPAPLDVIARIWDQLVANIGPLVILVPAGLVLGLLRHWRIVVLTVLWFLGAWLFALGYANARIERYELVPLLVASLWVALALDVAWDVIVSALAGPEPGDGATAGRRRRWQALGAAGLGIVLVAVLAVPLPDRAEQLDQSENTYGRRWLDAVMAELAPDAAVVSWWSFSTPLWYGRWVEGRRPDILIVDDRDIIDDGYGSALAAVERLLPERPVYIVRRAADLPPFAERYDLEQVDAVPGPGDLYRVLGPRPDAATAPA